MGLIIQQPFGLMQPQMQTPTALSQAAPVQNTYYDILPTTMNALIGQVSFQVATTGETLQVRVIVDGQTLTASQAVVAGTPYCVYLNLAGTLTITSTATNFNGGTTNVSLIPARSIRISVEKITANGTGTITGSASYWKQ